MNSKLCLPVLFASLAIVSTGCGDDGVATPSGRAFKGSVTLVKGGTSKETLPLADGYPQLELSSRFLLQLRGTLDGQTHDITLNIDPLKPLPARYDFPADALPLQLSYARDGAATPLGRPAGFLEVSKVDDASGGGGAATMSITLGDAGGSPLLEIDLIF
jgi:hypothetical protein